MPQKKTIKHHPIVQTVAQRLKAARHSLGISQQELSLKAQVSLTYIGKVERGESSVGIDMLARLAESLGVSTASLVADDAGSQPKPEAVRAQFQKQTAKIIARGDMTALASLSFIMGHLENSLSRRL